MTFTTFIFIINQLKVNVPKNNRPYLIAMYPVKFTIFAVKLLRCHFQTISFEISEMKLTF